MPIARPTVGRSGEVADAPPPVAEIVNQTEGDLQLTDEQIVRADEYIRHAAEGQAARVLDGAQAEIRFAGQVRWAGAEDDGHVAKQGNAVPRDPLCAAEPAPDNQPAQRVTVVFEHGAFHMPL